LSQRSGRLGVVQGIQAQKGDISEAVAWCKADQLRTQDFSFGSAASVLIPLDFVRFGPDGDQQSRVAALRKSASGRPEP